MSNSILQAFNLKNEGLKKYNCITIDSVDILKEEARIKIKATTSAFVSQKEIDYLKNEIVRANNNQFKVDIAMRYDFDMDNKKLFIDDYFDWLISGLRARRPIMFTILNKAKRVIEDNTISFDVTEIQKDTLNKNEFVQVVQKDLYNKYGLNVNPAVFSYLSLKLPAPFPFPASFFVRS